MYHFHSSCDSMCSCGTRFIFLSSRKTIILLTDKKGEEEQRMMITFGESLLEDHFHHNKSGLCFWMMIMKMAISASIGETKNNQEKERNLIFSALPLHHRRLDKCFYFEPKNLKLRILAVFC